jgi:hypothetical protein
VSAGSQPEIIVDLATWCTYCTERTEPGHFSHRGAVEMEMLFLMDRLGRCHLLVGPGKPSVFAPDYGVV